MWARRPKRGRRPAASNWARARCQLRLHVREGFDPGEEDVAVAAGHAEGTIGGAAGVKQRRRRWLGLAEGATEADILALEVDGASLAPEKPAGGDELLGAGIAVVVAGRFTEALHVALDATGNDVEVDAAATELARGGDHLGEEAGLDEAGANSDEETDTRSDGGEGCGHGPRFGDWCLLFEEAVGEAGGDEHARVAALLSGGHDLTEVGEARWAFGAEGAEVFAVAVDGDEPVEEGIGTIGHVVLLVSR